MVDKFKVWLFAELWKELAESGEVDITSQPQEGR